VAPAVGQPTDRATPTSIVSVAPDDWQSVATGVAEVDRVLGGGLVPGSVTLLGGEPGIGKSTLLLQVAAAVAAQRRRVLYVCGEESAQQVRVRAERLGCLAPELWLLAENELGSALERLDEVTPRLLVVDSIQAVSLGEVGTAPGSPTQIRSCVGQLVAVAKARRMAVVVVGHVTKEGSLAGPRTLEHLVDTVLEFEGDRRHALRLLRAVKHRFGPTDELGVFEMIDRGLVAVDDVSALFLSDRHRGRTGSVVVPTLQGHRPLLVELQALTTRGAGRRSAQGLDAGRLALLLAVLGERAGLQLVERDVYALAAGGVRVAEPGADLGLALAVASASTGVAVPDDVVACAEIGLGGELRHVGQMARRLSEAARLGFRRAIVPSGLREVPPGIEAVAVPDLGSALRAVSIAVDPRSEGQTQRTRTEVGGSFDICRTEVA
jgi:DNA repair protein RadA/Sms